MGRWHPVWAALMCLFFGFVTQMASQLQTLNTPMPSQFLLIAALRGHDHRRRRAWSAGSARRRPTAIPTVERG